MLTLLVGFIRTLGMIISKLFADIGDWITSWPSRLLFMFFIILSLWQRPIEIFLLISLFASAYRRAKVERLLG